MVRKQRVVEWLVDDLTGDELPEGQGQTLVFGVDGRTYEIDLSDDHADQIRGLLAPLITAGRQIDGPKQTGKKPLSPARRQQLDNARARQIELAAKRRELTAGDDEPEQLTSYQMLMERRNTLRTIRLWARENGFDQSMTGRLRPEVRVAWDEAHPDSPAPSETTWQALTGNASLTPDGDTEQEGQANGEEAGTLS